MSKLFYNLAGREGGDAIGAGSFGAEASVKLGCVLAKGDVAIRGAAGESDDASGAVLI